MWTTWEVAGGGMCWVELDAERTPPGLAIEVLVVRGWAIWLLEDGRLLGVVAAGLA